MKKSIIYACLVLLLGVSASGSVFAQAAHSAAAQRGKNATVAPTPPKEPAFKLIDMLGSGNVAISQSDWNKLQQYFDVFDRYSDEVEAELAKQKKKHGKKRPKAPRMNLNAVATTDLPLPLRASKESYVMLSAENRNNLNQNLAEMRDYIRATQALF